MKKPFLIKVKSSKGIFFKKEIPLFMEEAKKNVLILGTTGSGKTTTVILPMVNNLFLNDCSGLIMDVKSELYQDVIHIATKNNKLDKLHLIGTEEFCSDFNCLGSLENIEQLKTVLSACKGYKDNNSSNGYWFNNGLEDTIDMVIIDKMYSDYILEKPYKFTFERIFDLINDNETILAVNGYFEELKSVFLYAIDNEDIKSKYLQSAIKLKEKIIVSLDTLHCALSDFNTIINIEKKIRSDSFSIISSALNTEDKERAAEQKTWRSGQISTIIKNFLSEPFLSKLFSDDAKDTLHSLIFEQGKIVVLVIPSKYEAIGFSVGKLIRQLFFKAVMSNTPADREKYRLGDKFNRYTFLLVDEYQGFVNTDANDGVITDESWCSLSRSYENINIFATQSLKHLDSIIGTTDTDVIHTNCANEIILKAQDDRTLYHIGRVYQKFGKDNFEEIINPNERICLSRIENKGIKKAIQGNMDIRSQNIYHGKKYNLEKSISLSNFFMDHKTKSLDEAKKNKVKKLLEKIKNKNISLYANQNPNKKEKQEEKEERIKKIKSSNAYIEAFHKIDNFNKFFDNLKDNSLFENEDHFQFIIENIEKYKSKNDKTFEFTLENTLFVCKETYDAFKDVEAVFKQNNILKEYNKLLTIENNDIIKRVSDEAFLFHYIINKKQIKNICFIMGGGNTDSNQFDFYHDINNFKRLKKIFPDAAIFTGIGHADNIFMFDLLADRSFITPTDLAHFIVKEMKEKRDN